MDATQGSLRLWFESPGENSLFLLSPHLDENSRKELIILYEKFSPSRAGHLWIASSGSSQRQNESLKLVALSRDAMNASAASVNCHINAVRNDRWGLALPCFHVGGASIIARASLTGSAVEDYFHYHQKWNPEFFVSFLSEQVITLSSLVPTQLQDLVSANLKPPSALRAVFLGGAKLSPELYLAARSLGWPVLPTYGMTELCSQIASAELVSMGISSALPTEVPPLKILPHVQIKLNSQGHLSFRSKSLMSGYAQRINQEHFFAEVQQGEWYQSQDFGTISVDGKFLTPLGRAGDFVKILGEGVNLAKIEELLNEFVLKEFVSVQTNRAKPKFYVRAKEDSRRGAILELIAERSHEIKWSEVLQKFNLLVSPVERIQSAKEVAEIPVSELGKLKRNSI